MDIKGMMQSLVSKFKNMPTAGKIAVVAGAGVVIYLVSRQKKNDSNDEIADSVDVNNSTTDIKTPTDTETTTAPTDKTGSATPADPTGKDPEVLATYKIKKGDSLSGIVKKLGKAGKLPTTNWHTLWNKGKIKLAHGKDPDKITAGQTITFYA